MSGARLVLAALLSLVAVPAFAGGKTEAGRFHIHFAGANGAELDWAASVFRGADEELTPLFGDIAPAVINVTLSRSDAEWKDDAGQHATWAAGFVDGQEVFVNLPSILEQLPRFPSTVRHEAVHAMLGPRFSRNAPRWVVEGIAEHYSSPKPGISPRGFEDDQEISRALVGIDRTRRYAAYIAAHQRFARLIADCGEPAVLAWVKALRLDRGAVIGGVETPCRSTALPTAPTVTKQPSPPAPRKVTASLFWSRGEPPSDPLELAAKGITPQPIHAPAPRCGPFEPVLVDGRPVAWARKLRLTFDPDSPTPVPSTTTWD